MNEHVRPEEFKNATQAAEGWPRRRFTIDEIYKAQEAGIIDSDERFELIGGEIVLMSPKGIRHEIIRTKLNLHWGRNRPDSIEFAGETSFRLSIYDVPEPDFILYRETTGLANVDGKSVLLAVEVSDSTIYKDLGLKARLYADFGVQEYWVIKAENLVTTVHKLPTPDGYASKVEFPSTELLIPEAAPEMGVRLADLPLGFE
jgi:Uma2 family endonuclease